MRATAGTILAAMLGSSIVQVIATSAAQAQGPGTGGVLGGYGAMAGASASSMGSSFNIVDAGGMGAGIIVPSGGRGGTIMPASMSGGGAMLFGTRASSMAAYSRTPFTLDVMRGSMGSMSRVMGRSSGRRAFALSGSGLTGGIGTTGLRPSMSASPAMGVMPPSFGYPFYQPPSLLLPSSTGMGMSM